MRRSALIGLTLVLCATAPAATRQTAEETSSQPTEPSLAERQRVVRDRIQRLESRMLELSRLLAESEPEKAERLRDALQYTGSHRIKTRAEELTRLLRSGQFSDADRQQELLLADLDALLTLLTSSLNEVERRRAERQRLEALKRAVRELMDEQLQILYRTQHVEQRMPPADAQGAADAVTEMFRQLERLQRLARRKADDLRRDMEQRDQHERQAPGTPQVEQAGEHMRQAADQLGERQPGDARGSQERALEQLQRALDELDDALRQVRREESEETLAALEARFRSMLTRERQVLASLVTLDEKGVENWTRVDRLQVAEATETQQGVHEDCEATRRILVDEGTTVIVPELVGQMAADMLTVLTRLERSDTSMQTQAVLRDIIALLEEVLAAIERKRAEEARQGKGEPAPDDRPRPLLPTSAELKLLRSAQVRLNQRTTELAGAADPEPTQAMERLSQRQRRLAELARRMHERQ